VAVGSGKYPWGNEWPPPKNAGNYDPSLKVDSYEFTSPVGSFPANRHGLYDMGGNVWQWCEDWYRANMNESAVLEKLPWLKDDGGGQTFRVVRGASWRVVGPEYLLSSGRLYVIPGGRVSFNGFRCVLVVGSSR
jgi:formylglycine-generating enzyme required for sulfatase activity